MRKLCSRSYSSCCWMFPMQESVSVMKVRLFHWNPLLSVSRAEMRFWVLLEENDRSSKLSDWHLSFTWNWAQIEDLMLGVQFLCKIWENYVPAQVYRVLAVSKQVDTSKKVISMMKLHLFHFNTLLSVSWGEMRFWVLLEEKDSLS